MPLIFLASRQEADPPESLGVVRVERGEVELTARQLAACLNWTAWWIVRLPDQVAARLLQDPVVKDVAVLAEAIPVYCGANEENPWKPTPTA